MGHKATCHRYTEIEKEALCKGAKTEKQQLQRAAWRICLPVKEQSTRGQLAALHIQLHLGIDVIIQ